MSRCCFRVRSFQVLKETVDGESRLIVYYRDEARAADPEVAETDVLLEPGEELLHLPETPQPEDAEQAVRGVLPDLPGGQVGKSLERDRRCHVHHEERRQVPAQNEFAASSQKGPGWPILSQGRSLCPNSLNFAKPVFLAQQSNFFRIY